MRASDFEISNYSKLDKILSKLCDIVVQGQESDRDYGMVAAAVVDPDNQIVARLNRPGRDGKRIHAEHAAMLDYTNKYGSIPEGSIIVTTLSPCNEAMDERDGPSCTELINNSSVKKVYCGYMDPTQDNDTRQFNLMETADQELRNKCKQFADTFLDDVDETHSLEERRKKKRRVRHAAYGPGLFGGYGYYAGYSGDSSGDGGGGDGGSESIKNEDAMMGKLEDGGKIVRILKKAHTVPFSDEKNWLLVDVDPAKGNKGLGLKWIPADTKFTWVRPYRDTVEQGVAEGSQEINWVKPNFDFEWHEVEEQSRMKQVPVDVRQYYQKHFPNKDAWLKAVQNGKAVAVPPDHAYEIRNAPFDKASLQKVLAPTGHEGPIGPAKEKRVNDLFDKGQVEMPIILKTSQGLWLIGGKTRLGTANYVKGLPAKVWLISGEQGVAENFADGKNPQDKGDSKRHGINTKASVSSLRKTAKQGGRKGQLAHWLANMKSGRQK